MQQQIPKTSRICKNHSLPFHLLDLVFAVKRAHASPIFPPQPPPLPHHLIVFGPHALKSSPLHFLFLPSLPLYLLLNAFWTERGNQSFYLCTSSYADRALQNSCSNIRDSDFEAPTLILLACLLC